MTVFIGSNHTKKILVKFENTINVVGWWCLLLEEIHMFWGSAKDLYQHWCTSAYLSSLVQILLSTVISLFPLFFRGREHRYLPCYLHILFTVSSFHPPVLIFISLTTPTNFTPFVLFIDMSGSYILFISITLITPTNFTPFVSFIDMSRSCICVWLEENLGYEGPVYRDVPLPPFPVFFFFFAYTIFLCCATLLCCTTFQLYYHFSVFYHLTSFGHLSFFVQRFHSCTTFPFLYYQTTFVHFLLLQASERMS